MLSDPSLTACHTCGGQLDPDALFCPRCGTACGTVALPAAPPTPAPDRTKPPLAAVRDRGDPMIGRELIGQYVIRSKIGEGGMGAVYLADQPSVGRHAVVKVMHPEFSRDPSVAPRFEVEARAASLLNHPHIVTIYNYGAMDDGTLFLAMEHCAGQSLDGLISGSGALRWERAASIGAQVCDALGEAHRRGVVHRDLKPSNIMLVEVGRQRDFVKVLDFGIAKVEGVRMTRTGSVVGTPQYMSPEQFRGESLDGRADLYSLAVLLYETVAGRLPFESESAAGFMHKHLGQPARAPSELCAGLKLPRGFEGILLCALAKERDERFRDADEMGQALERVLHTPDHIPPTRTLARASGGRGRGRLWFGIAGGAAVAAAASVGTAFLLRSGPRTEPPPAAAPSTPGLVWATPGSGQDPAGAGIRNSSAPDAAPVVAAAPVEPVRASPAAKDRRGAKAKRVALAKTTRPERSGADPVETGNASPPAPTPPSPPPGPPPGPAPSATSSQDPDRMLAELRRLVLTARVPPSTWDSTVEGYRNALAAWAPAERDAKRRDYLQQLIALYRRPGMQQSAAERQPFSRLRSIFLGMETKAGLSVEQRSKILESTCSTYDGGSYSAHDRDYYKRMAAISLIRRYAADPDGALR